MIDTLVLLVVGVVGLAVGLGVALHPHHWSYMYKSKQCSEYEVTQYANSWT